MGGGEEPEGEREGEGGAECNDKGLELWRVQQPHADEPLLGLTGAAGRAGAVVVVAVVAVPDAVSFDTGKRLRS